MPTTTERSRCTWETHRLLNLLETFYKHDSLLLASLIVPVWILLFRNPTFATVPLMLKGQTGISVSGSPQRR